MDANMQVHQDPAQQQQQQQGHPGIPAEMVNSIQSIVVAAMSEYARANPQAQAPAQADPQATIAAAAAAAVLQASQDAKEAKAKKDSEPREDPWSSYLHTTEVEATAQTAQDLVKLFKEPPSLSALNNTFDEIPNYKGIIPTPPVRPIPGDKALHDLQEKLRATMALFVEAEESNDRSASYSAAAFLRSAHEDVRQMRRRNVAGKKAHQLDARVDADQASLFSKSEEAKLKKTWGRGRGGGKGNNVNNSSKDNTGGKSSSFRSWGKKGGKGKGRARSSSAHSFKK